VITTNSFKNELFKITNESFNDFALNLFRFQSNNNEIYKTYIKHIHVDPTNVKTVENIPFLPIDFFKHFEVKTGSWMPDLVFESSGTTGSIPSKYPLRERNFYFKNSEFIFHQFFGGLRDYTFLALLPSYLERQSSSLVFMVDHFINSSGSALSGFYLHNHEELYEKLAFLKKKKIRTVLIGVSFALIEFCKKYQLDFKDLIVIETGGMKGRRKEMTRTEVHQVIKGAFSVKMVHSEYGMTELLSQAYSKGEGRFIEPGTMKILIREINDPFAYTKANKNGGINVIDLANIDTCSFVETKDLGIKYTDGSFEVLGRLDNSDMRGCNLMLN